MEEKTAQQIGAEFAAQMMGVTLSEGPAPADTPLGRIQSFAAEHGEDALTPAHWDRARAGLPLVP
ncbi:hypothetical protein [Streptomyces phage phiScoe3]|nr:hypothetical protein [Streptomyces phage phiScoe3]